MLAILAFAAATSAYGQAPAQPASPPKAAAPIDLTGYWVSLVTEDWRYRMVTPPKGDFISIPLNATGRNAANQWDPSKDEAAGEQCRAYGAAAILRVPGRLHITWQDDNTIQLEADAGTQSRTFYFGTSQTGGGDWQGVSSASWDRSAGPLGLPPGPPPNRGSLKVMTTNMKAGYLRKNGIPYSANAVLTEYYDRFDIPGGDSLLVVSSELVDPAYLTQPYWSSAHFKKQSDASGWNPTPCSAR
jgi:hypothetical protein